MEAIQALLLLAMVILSGMAGFCLRQRMLKKKMELLAWFEKTFLRKQGWTIGIGPYELLSFDGGKLWYAIGKEENGAVTILGTAEVIFPGLLARLEGIDALVAYAKRSGPLTLAGDRAVADRQLLEAAGFTVDQTD